MGISSFETDMTRFLIAFLVLFAYADDSIQMKACYARCNCWTDFPDMGGQITHEMDAWCFQDACWCSYNQDACPYGTLKTNPFCCSLHGFQCNEFDCDTDGNCEHNGKKDQFLKLLRKN